MTASNGDRSAFFPAIEKKHGEPIRLWFDLLSAMGDAKYAEQIALLREDHGFSQAHANAVVMQHRGSTSSRRHSSVDELLDSLEPAHAELTRKIFAAIAKKYPKLETVVAWNQPMLKMGSEYVIGVSASKKHLTIGPWGNDVIAVFAKELAGLETNKKTIKVPIDWKVDGKLLCRLVQYRLDELG
jgi:uncharacterized protein YdhG (YjbR/CyaY superfamily)